MGKSYRAASNEGRILETDRGPEDWGLFAGQRRRLKITMLLTKSRLSAPRQGHSDSLDRGFGLMTVGRRLLAVGAILALGAVLCYSHVWGEPAKKPDRPAGIDTGLPRDGGLKDELTASRFVDNP